MARAWKMTPEQRQKISDAKTGKPNGIPKKFGDLISLITKERTQRGPAHYAWKGGTKRLKQGDRASPEYRAWRKAVFERDEYTCEICTVYLGGGDLEAHHLKSYAEFPELRFVVDNGATLCNYHHQREVHDC